MKAEEAYALSRKYTENTVAGAGAVAGKPCQIQSITDITGGHRITFLWKDNSNVDHTSVMDVMDGKEIKAVAVNSSNHLIISYDDDTIVDAGEIDIHSAVNSVNGKTGNVDLTASDVGALSDSTYEEEIHGVNLLKNEATSQTINGVTFTVNADGSVTANGTATANTFFVIYPNTATNKYENNIISGCPTGGNANNSYCLTARVGLQSDDSYVRSVDDIGNGQIIPKVNTSTEWIRFYIRIANGYTANNLVFRPMIRKADIEDSTYRPYNPQAIQNQLNAQGVLGAKNLLPNELKAKTVGGVTVTINDDNSVTLNGTATETLDNLLELSSKINDILEVGKRYVLTGCPANGGLNSYALVWRLNNASAPGLPGFDDGDGSEFTWQQFTGYVAIRIRIQSGYTCNNLTFKPMLRLASDPDDTYVPYAMTNRELTELAGHAVTYPLEWNSDLNLDTNKSGRLHKYGKIYFVSYAFKATTDFSGNTPIIKLPKNGLVNGNYVVVVNENEACYGGKAQKDGNDYVSISCPIVAGTYYRAQCIFIDLS